MKQKSLDQAMKGILDAGSIEDIPPPPMTKENLNRKFKMKLDRKRKPIISEI